MMSSFNLSIDLETDPVQRSIVPVKRLRHSQELYERVLSGLVENKKQISAFRNQPIIIEEIMDTPSGLPAYEYVIVTHSEYMPAFTDFVTWKKQKGIDIGVVAIEDVLSLYAGDLIFDSCGIYDNAGKLRQYLFEAHHEGTVFALLAGDLPDFPIRYGRAQISSNFIFIPDEKKTIPTDLYFADFDGNWNVDGDTCFGEFVDDSPDFMAELFVGRLTCSSQQDILNWVTKMLIYEKDPGQGNPAYLIESYMTEADDCQEVAEAEAVAVHLPMFNHFIMKERPDYSSISPYFPKGSDVIRELNTKRYGLMSWFNHGGTGNGESGIATMTSGENGFPRWNLQAQERNPYSLAEPDSGNGLDNLTNYSEPFVIYSVSCDVCPFDITSNYNNNGARNCGESFTVDNLAGGIAFLGNCKNGLSPYSKNMYIKFATFVSDYLAEQNYPRLGIMEFKSKASYASDEKQKYLCYSHNLIGDPECALWTNIPQRLAVTVSPQTAVLNTPNCFQVEVNNLGHGKKAVVTIYMEGALHERTEVIGNEQNTAIAFFNNIIPASQGDITVTVTSFGCYPHQEHVPVEESCEIVIENTEVWHSDEFVACDIVINDNASLFVLSELCMSPNTKIIVKPGGRLVINGGKLTSTCSDMLWQGIEVWGNRNQPQKMTDGRYPQGVVELSNGATIENAVCALNLWRPNHWSSTGGIVKATDAVFRNNAKSVHALFYKNYSDGVESSYEASFDRCQFIVDENYKGNNHQVFHKHVDLNNVKGVLFLGCDFSVAACSDNISYWSSGIAAYEAGFTVKGIAEDINVYPYIYKKSTFSGFFTAVYAISNGSKRPPAITVERSIFTNNDYGVYTGLLSYAAIRLCDFDVKRNGYWPCGTGIFSENMYGFSIEENLFQKTNTFNGSSYGIVINNSDGQNRIRRNYLEGLRCGNLAIGRNIYLTSSNNYLGLEYSCNTNHNNEIDFYVQKEDGVFSGIQSSQGSSLSAARNTFSTNGYHFYNEGDFKINYYYYDVAGYEDEKPLYYNEKFFVNPCLQAGNCSSKLFRNESDDEVLLVLPPAMKQQIEQEYYDSHNAYNRLKSVYESRMDHGNTDNMVLEINQAQSEDMWRLRSILLGASPYLSEDVLFATSDRGDVFSESVLFEILLSNPEELKKDSLRNHLKNKTNPLPQYMTDILDQVANGTSARTLLQNSMAAHRHNYSRAACDMIRSIINDTVLDMVELRGWLGNLETIQADREIIATYIDEGDFSSAIALADMLPTLYGLAGNDLAEHENYMNMIELYHDLYNTGRNTMQLDSTETAFVEEIAFYGTGYPRTMARAILSSMSENGFASGSIDCPSISVPERGRGGNTISQKDISKALGFSASISPNPASTWAAIDYTLPAGATKATLILTNTLGVAVMTAELNGNQGQKVLDLRPLAAGVYGYSVRCGEHVMNGKIVVTK